MKFTSIVCFFVVFLAGSMASVSAHQPRLIDGNQVVEIKRPEVSQAFYATLKGSPHLYQIDAAREFQLYLGLLVPDLPQIDRDVAAMVFAVAPDGSEEPLFILDGATGRWETFFEPFAGDRYYKGPERTETLPAGLYRVQVSSPDNRGKYVLAVGREEKFSAREITAMIAALPALKRDFFDQSPLTAFFNLVGLFMFVFLLVLIASAAGLFWLIRFVLKRSRAKE